jgi:putative colanic acid biosynthesis UDP-glucose lipid carrier transferase
VYSKTDTQLAFFATVRMLLPPFVSTFMLLTLTQTLDVRFTGSYVALALVSALLVWIAIGRDQRPQLVTMSGPLSVVGQTLIEWGAVVGTLLLIAYATKTSENFSRRALLLWFTITPLVIIAMLTIVNAWARAVAASPRNARRAVIVGSSYMSSRLLQTAKNRPELGLHIERAFELQHDTRDAQALVAAQQSVHDYVNRFRIEVVFLALPIEAESTRALLAGLRDTTSSVYLIPNIALQDLIQARTDEIDGVPVIALCESPLHGPNAVAKRTTDIVFGSILLLCALPAMLAIAAAIKLTSPGPVIFKQRRYGLDGEQIAVHKFRTMTVTENGGRIVQATRNDPRVTPLGRFLRRTSLDELPQLLNVLAGTMSLVGPRPHAVAHNEEYRKLINGYMVRHKVTPGITGLAQVNGCRGETATLDDMKRRVEYDLEYMRHWCLLLDLKILMKTVVLLFKDERAY